MESEVKKATSGNYSASLLGTIRSHLEGLQGYDVMALELIQNADDAKAKEIVFDITDEGLFVENSGEFTYCGDLNTHPCAFRESQGYGCDYHRITEVASGGKLSHGDNIGRFGIGFVSTYQITDHPEIRSSGISLTLHPEAGQWFVKPNDLSKGTVFFLPWARDPNTEGRRALCVSHISAAHIDQVGRDFEAVLRTSLLFLRHVEKAEIRRNGELVLACDLDRSEDSDLIVSFRPGDEIEQWHILRADAREAAQRLYATHPRLEGLGRDTKISIGFRIDPEPLAEGRLYAFLPTEQSTGLPLHINADFFPESDRKGLIFSGHQHQQAWNEMLIDAAAAEIAREPEALLKLLGHNQLWQIFGRAFDLSKSQQHPPCFSRFWELIKSSGSQARIAPAQDGSIRIPSEVMLPTAVLDVPQVRALEEMGGRVVVEELRSYRNVMSQLGAPILTLDRTIGLMTKAFANQSAGASEVTVERVNDFYRPLWSVVNELLPIEVASQIFANVSIQKLKSIPFLVTEDLVVVTINQSFLAPSPLKPDSVAVLLPRLAILSSHILDCPRIARQVSFLKLTDVASRLQQLLTSPESTNEVIGVEKDQLRGLYNLLAELDRLGPGETAAYHMLRGLPIWLSSKGLVKADQALLPGNFNDPTGLADLLDTSVLTDIAREFVSGKIGVRSQTIEAFVQTVLPRFFDHDGPVDPTKYQRLVTELAEHPSLNNDEGIRGLLRSLPLIPTQNGGWAAPDNTYRWSNELEKVLGDAKNLWVDFARIPNSRSVVSFLDVLGIRSSPTAAHLADRMLYIAQSYKPTEEAKRASSEPFYVLCDNFDAWKDKREFHVAIASLRGVGCFPSDEDNDQWYRASDLYAPFRAEAFRSQAHILGFKNTARLKTELLQMVGVSINPETQFVVDHLFYCIEHALQPSVLTYQILNERAQQSDPLIGRLRGKPCIYVEHHKAFVRPNQLYWTTQLLGRFAFTIPGNLETFKPLFTEIGVKNAPDAEDYVDLLIDIVGEYFEQGKPVEGTDRHVYETCLNGISLAAESGSIDDTQLKRLGESPSILNLLGRPTHPDELLLQDSEWHTAFFFGELDQALCRPAAELWPLLEDIGVRRLSECAEVALEFVDGEERSEQVVADKLQERAEIVTRLLHDKSTIVRRAVARAFATLTAISHEVVRIQARVSLGDNTVDAPPAPVPAFYDIANGRLILSRPVSERSWAPILNALFHQLMPDESGIEISKLTLSVRPLMGMQVSDGHQELTDAGIPFLDADRPVDPDENLTSSELQEIGGAVEIDGEPDKLADGSWVGTPVESDGSKEREADERPNDGAEPQPNDGITPSRSGGGAGQAEGSGNMTSHGQSAGSVTGGGQNKFPADKRVRKPRPKHKDQWDRRLLSYVRKKSDADVDGDQSDGASEHNLAVEVVARAAVCAYEKERGRVAEPMAQTHPGYDIISRDPLTGEDRFIEVKGVNGEWNQTGVGLSRLQFSNALDYGDRYWLYVVEFVSDSQHMRVHAIRSPATQVTSFMFDGNWRDAVTDERADPARPFIAGARIQHQSFGYGRIKSMEMKGSTRLMSIEFESGVVRTVSLNLHVMTVVEEDDGNDPPRTV